MIIWKSLQYHFLVRLRKKNVTPRYDQISYDKEKLHNEWQQIISPNPEDTGSWIHQDAWFHLGKFDADATTEYTIRKQGNGIYLMVIEGEISHSHADRILIYMWICAYFSK